MNLRLPVKAYSLVAVPLVFELAFVFVLVFFQGQLEESYSKEIQARRVANVINQGLADCLKAGTYGVLAQMGGGKLLISEGQSKLKDLYRVKKALMELNGLSDLDRRSIQTITSSLDAIMKNFPDPTNVDRSDKANYVMSLHVAVQDLLDEANLLLDRQGRIQEIEQTEQRRLRSFINNAVLFGVVFNVLLAVFLAGIFNKSIIQRLEVVLANAGRLVEGKQLLPRVSGSDEVSDLDRVFHQMAEAIEQATEREKALLKNSSDVIFSMDTLLEIKVVSEACRRLWLYEPAELVGAELDRIIAPEALDRARNHLLNLSKEDATCQLEVAVLKKDGSQMDASLSAYFSAKENQIFCVAHDISDRKELERQKEDFLSMVSHDLRSPITSLLLTFDMFLEGILGSLNDRGTKMAETSRRDLTRLNRLVNDLLDADKLEKGKMEIDKSRISAGQLKEMVLNSVSQQAAAKEIEIISTWPDIELNCDLDRMIQVLVNLLNNAIKFSETNSKIELNLEERPGAVKIEVKDSGRGIPEEEQARIFDKFRQVSRSDATEKGGSGLGLAICKALVEAHGGSIKVKSKPGEGSCFSIELPA